MDGKSLVHKAFLRHYGSRISGDKHYCDCLLRDC